MAERIASIRNAFDFLPGAATLEPGTEKHNAFVMVLEGLSRAMMTEITGSPARSLLQSEATERYGNERAPRGYGRHNRNRILLRRLPVVSVSEVNDNGAVVAADNYRVDNEAGILYLLRGAFTDEPLAVQVKYTAGYAETNTDDELLRALAVPLDLRDACLEQLAHLWSENQPGGAVRGALSIVRPDGSVQFEQVAWLKNVARTLAKYRWTV